MENKFKNPVFVILIAILCNILWGTAFPAMKLLYKELGIVSRQVSSLLVLAGIRFFIASIIILIIYKYIIKGKFYIPKKELLLTILLIGILQTLFQYLFFFLGIVNTTGAKGSILVSSEVFFAFIFAHLVFKNDKLSISKVIGLLIGFTGVIIVNMKNGSISSGFTITGEGFMLMASLSNATASIIIKKYTTYINTVYMTGLQMMFGSLLLIIIGFLYGEETRLDFNTASSLILVYSSFLSAIAFALWNTLIKHNSVSKISIYKFLTPVFGTTFSIWLLADEFLENKILVSLLLVSLGIISIYYKKRKNGLLFN